jgi:hypothetical protein
MLTFNDAQMTDFDAIAWREFRTRLAVHLAETVPWGAAIWEPHGPEEFIGFAAERALHYGFETERQITVYVTLAALLGSRFDEDPCLPWARGTLFHPAHANATARCDALLDAALLHLRRVDGPEGEALLDGLGTVLPALEGKAQDAPIPLLQKAFPARAASAEAQAALAQAMVNADGFALIQPAGGLMAGLLTLFYGPFFYADPQWPALRDTLYDATLPPAEKTAKARAITLGWVKARIGALPQATDADGLWPALAAAMAWPDLRVAAIAYVPEKTKPVGIVWRPGPGATEQDLAAARALWSAAKSRRLPDDSKPASVLAMEALEKSPARVPIIVHGGQSLWTARVARDPLDLDKGPGIYLNPKKTGLYADGTPRDPESWLAAAAEQVFGLIARAPQGDLPPGLATVMAENAHRALKDLPPRLWLGLSDVPQAQE